MINFAISLLSQMIDLDKAKYCILNGLKDCFDNFCNQHGIRKYMFTDGVKKVNEKLNTRIGVLNNTLHKKKQEDSFNSLDAKKVLESLHNRFALVPIDKAKVNTAVICKQFHASVIVKEVGLGSNNTTNPYI